MTMEASKAGDALYAIGSIQLTADQKVDVNGLIEYLQQGMLANLKSDSGASPKAEIVTIKTAGQPSYELPAQTWEILGSGPDGQQRFLKLLFVSRKLPDGQVLIYQVSVLQQLLGGADKKTNLEERDMFISSFKPY